MGIITIDFEASCLPQRGPSYPIEVGIAGDYGSSAWLIRPHVSWLGWQWSGEAEKLHGLTRHQLQTEGQPVQVVANALCEALVGHRVIADSSFDNTWMETLAMAAGINCPARIEHVSALFDELETTAHEIAVAQAAIHLPPTYKHRARCDALWLLALIKNVTEASFQRQASVATRATALPAKIAPPEGFEYDSTRHTAHRAIHYKSLGRS